MEKMDFFYSVVGVLKANNKEQLLKKIEKLKKYLTLIKHLGDIEIHNEKE